MHGEEPYFMGYTYTMEASYVEIYNEQVRVNTRTLH